jgi:hypothetical protein
MLSTFKTPLPKGVAPDGSLQFFLENFSMQLFVDYILLHVLYIYIFFIQKKYYRFGKNIILQASRSPARRRGVKK